MTEAYLYDAVRTPRGRGRKDGSLHGITPVRLAATALAALVARNPVDTAALDDVILGCVEPVGEQSCNIARVAALLAGYDLAAPGFQLNRFCASGLEACNLAAALVMSGQADLVVAGGVESMSRVPMMSSGGMWAVDPQVAMATRFVPQGISADLIATLHGYSRGDLDAYAAESHRRAAAAQAAGHYDRSLVPVQGVAGELLLARDECVRPETSAASLAALKPSFAEQGEKLGFDAIAIARYPEVSRIEHLHHAGNSSGIVDGAAAVLFGTREAGARYGLAPRARVRSFASVGTEPTIMLTGPSFAAEKVARRAGLRLADVDLFEVNEAFAAVVLRFMEATGVGHERVNVAGGAIALGHPLGATGAMILGTLVDELERRDLALGIATLCVGAGMGTAMLVERVEGA
jgi:acetyl-CoA C-acetyltransferase